MIILEENLKWHLEAFASELFIYRLYVCLSVCLYGDLILTNEPFYSLCRLCLIKFLDAEKHQAEEGLYFK